MEVCNLNVLISSPFGETSNIIVLLLAFSQNDKEQIWILDGNGQNKEYLKLSVIELEENLIDALIGFHWLRMIVRIPFSEKVEKMTRSIKL